MKTWTPTLALTLSLTALAPALADDPARTVERLRLRVKVLERRVTDLEARLEGQAEAIEQLRRAVMEQRGGGPGRADRPDPQELDRHVDELKAALEKLDAKRREQPGNEELAAKTEMLNKELSRALQMREELQRQRREYGEQRDDREPNGNPEQTKRLLEKLEQHAVELKARLAKLTDAQQAMASAGYDEQAEEMQRQCGDVQHELDMVNAKRKALARALKQGQPGPEDQEAARAKSEKLRARIAELKERMLAAREGGDEDEIEELARQIAALQAKLAQVEQVLPQRER